MTKAAPLSCYDFGRALLAAGDLDPVYTVVWNGGLERPVLERWLLAYWCFYHAGTASWITDVVSSAEYWGRMTEAAGSADYPRSSERRHYRGENAMKSMEYLRRRGLLGLYGDLQKCGTSARQVTEVVRQWVGFGPWIAFKVADMIERVGLRHVEFTADVVLYDSPREAAEMLWDEEGQPHAGFGSAAGEWALGRVLGELNPTPAPPSGDREMNYQEAETVLCKWKSYRGGHYEVGEDVAAVRKGLLRFARCRLAQRLYAGGRKGGLWT